MMSLERVKLPDALRDPFRDSHFTDPGYLRAVAGCQGLSCGARGRLEDRASRPLAAADRQV